MAFGSIYTMKYNIGIHLVSFYLFRLYTIQYSTTIRNSRPPVFPKWVDYRHRLGGVDRLINQRCWRPWSQVSLGCAVGRGYYLQSLTDACHYFGRAMAVMVRNSKHWRIDHSQILSRQEITQVLDDLKRRGLRSVNSRQNLIVFRLATCCGCRASEIAGLRLQDIKVRLDQPYIYIGKAIAKRNKARKVPLWWDRSTDSD